MKPTVMQETITFQFDYLKKCAINSTVKDYHRTIRHRSKRDIPFTDLSVTSLAQMGAMEEYKIDEKYIRDLLQGQCHTIFL